MLVFEGLSPLAGPAPAVQQPTVLTVGMFDGVHLGHQRLIGGVVAEARASGCLAGVVTFYPHPRQVLGGFAPRCLTEPAQKLALLRGLEVDLAVVVPFTRAVAAVPAGEFVAWLARCLRMCALWIGPDFALGRGREGDAAFLRQAAAAGGWNLHTLNAPVLVAGQPVSSTRIRTALAAGNLGEAAACLGHRALAPAG